MNFKPLFSQPLMVPRDDLRPLYEELERLRQALRARDINVELRKELHEIRLMAVRGIEMYTNGASPEQLVSLLRDIASNANRLV